jgi:signal transduction histidine kinase
MNRRLLVSFLTLTVFVLAVLEIPLGVSYQRNERHDLTAKVERDAVTLATLAEDTLEAGAGIGPADLRRAADRYQADTGGRVVIVDADGTSIVDTNPPAPGSRSFATRPEIVHALGGEVAAGTRHSDTLRTDLLYVAVPVASSGIVHGAVRITYPMSAVEARITRYWLILAAIAAIVLTVVSAIGLLIARWVSRPLADVERAAAAAGAGDLTARAPTDAGPPEVRSLAASLNDTVAKLDELVRSREAFVADASHQLRTPLAALRLRLENLEHDLAPDATPDLEAALSEVARLSRLVDGLLALARTDSTSAAPEPIDLRATIAERLDAWSALGAEQAVTLVADVEEALAARATPGRIEQVLDNLLANALEVSPERSNITVSAAANGEWVEIHVIDQGPGMTEHERAHAFDRFWRADSGTSGTGLGLAIVERLVTSDGGEVELVSAGGGGIDAVVRLPAVHPATRRTTGEPATQANRVSS